MKGIYASLGKSGMKVKLTKTAFRKGKTSGVKPGKEKIFELFVSIRTGSQIRAIREVDSEDPEKQRRKVDVTSKVLSIGVINEKTFRIKTETSFYRVEFYL